MLVPIPQAAAIMQCHEETIRRWIRTKKCGVVKTPSGQKVDLSELGLPAAEVAKLETEWKAALDRAADRVLAK